MRQPNVLFIMPDEMRGDCLSLEGHPVLETPVIDSIGEGGTYFSRAYTTSPSCIPARHAMMTGLYPSSNGMVGYRGGIPLEFPTLAQTLKDSGYATSLVGRCMHLSPADEPYGFEKRILGSTYIKDDDYAKFLKDKAPESGGIEGIGISCNGREARGWPLEESLHPSHWTVSQARELLGNHEGDQPIFHVTSFYSPHSPLFPPQKLMDDFMEMELPNLAIGEWASPPSPEEYENDIDSPRVNMKGEELRRAQAGYFGLIKHIDHLVEGLIDDFKEKSESMDRPWVIIFSTDHGEMLGDHYYFRKCEPYEGSSRIPFLIQASEEFGFKKAQKCTTPVCLEDIMPTLLDMCQVSFSGNLDGKSLVGILRGDSEGVRDCLHTEHATCYSKEQGFHMLTDGSLKYIWRPYTGQEQLFDLNEDPNEIVDLSCSEGHRQHIDNFRRELVSTLTGRPEGFVENGQLITGCDYPPFMESMA